MRPCKYAMFTVPHSGTRYIADTFTQAGVEAKQGRPRGPRANVSIAGPEGLMWGHWLQRNKSPHRFENVTKDQTFAVVRDPAASICTHFGEFWIEPEYRDDMWLHRLGEKKGNLIGQYETQLMYADTVGYWHRVEDPLDGLAAWTGVELKPGAPSHSKPTPLKQAVKDKDVETIRKLMEPSDFWDWFVTDITPMIEDFYSDLGYDIWWKNG